MWRILAVTTVLPTSRAQCHDPRLGHVGEGGEFQDGRGFSLTTILGGSVC